MLVLGFNINLEMNPLWTWALLYWLISCDALIGGSNGFLHVVQNSSKHSCGILTFRLGCVIDLKNDVVWCLSDGVLPFCFSKCSIAHVQGEFA
ncbi:hypothetical protein AMTRI_Chr07g79480 [Amborella trichopoda]